MNNEIFIEYYVDGVIQTSRHRAHIPRVGEHIKLPYGIYIVIDVCHYEDINVPKVQIELESIE